MTLVTQFYQLPSFSQSLTLAQKLPSNLRAETICFAAVYVGSPPNEIDECLHSGGMLAR